VWSKILCSGRVIGESAVAGLGIIGMAGDVSYLAVLDAIAFVATIS
jgi:hypothetical protein